MATQTKIYLFTQYTGNFKFTLFQHHFTQSQCKNLIDMNKPALTKYYHLLPTDLKTWDQEYAKEYYGLVKLDTWELITEEEYL